MSLMTLKSLLNKNRKIIFTGYIPEVDLPKFYKIAKALIFPSIYEGFGLPPLEAQACGCPVIVSKIASLPEVYGDSALYCDPYDANDIAEKIENLINNDKLQAELKISGLNNVKRFSWQNSAQKILSLFKEIL
ncbi:glycosyltransferase family 4 protein [Thermoanaerobacterium thermosaccharolyticum]|uniref:glycosyltransferase family 4 protein n=1 Tax=Thermoanaerobacterium thermosaccharolyticum TaxID=1517 RepID=UPI0020A4BE44|nr:glycosyltransferase family 1 protein [Thermoanaerobacterium thermosaccharolyticum]MCP2241258.1 glycosyltransferase involved in cell wall biosynthesis [Thermoanaerobacterium thermosaccharolyticum]